MNHALLAVRPGIAKAEHFEENFPHPLECTEWKVRWPVEGFEFATYNPDFYCPALNCYIECCTSKGNYGDSHDKWQQVIESGRPLRVYWWEGEEITAHLLTGSHRLELSNPPKK